MKSNKHIVLFPVKHKCLRDLACLVNVPLGKRTPWYSQGLAGPANSPSGLSKGAPSHYCGGHLRDKAKLRVKIQNLNLNSAALATSFLPATACFLNILLF